jgi:hypothetical protein
VSVTDSKQCMIPTILIRLVLKFVHKQVDVRRPDLVETIVGLYQTRN